MFKQSVDHTRGTLAEHIGKDIVQLEVAHGQAVLHSILLAGGNTREFDIVTTQITELTDIRRRNKAGANKITLEQFRDPLRVLLVGFLALDSLHIFGVCQADDANLFKGIENRNPILTAGFHAHVVTMIGCKPFG